VLVVSLELRVMNQRKNKGRVCKYCKYLLIWQSIKSLLTSRVIGIERENLVYDSVVGLVSCSLHYINYDKILQFLEPVLLYLQVKLNSKQTVVGKYVTCDLFFFIFNYLA